MVIQEKAQKFETKPELTPIPESAELPNIESEASRSVTIEKKSEQPGRAQPLRPVRRAAHTPVRPSQKSEQVVAIEKILEQDLSDIYIKLSAAEQMAFKEKGEETALKIEQQLRKAKVKVNDIVKLIIDWLKTLPGVNAFFLQQEAKIKADKIIRLKR